MSSSWGLLSQQDVRKQQYLGVLAAVRAGKMKEAEGGRRLKALGFPDRDNPFVQGPSIVPTVKKLVGFRPSDPVVDHNTKVLDAMHTGKITKGEATKQLV